MSLLSERRGLRFAALLPGLALGAAGAATAPTPVALSGAAAAPGGEVGANLRHNLDELPVQPKTWCSAPTRPRPERPSAHGKADIEPGIGMASWYGPPYTNRKAADGSIYDQNAMTAAHRTLPMGSIVRVTNLTNNLSVMVRITDRGPFIDGRIIDLSLAAAKAVDVYRPGTAKVQVEAFCAAGGSILRGSGACADWHVSGSGGRDPVEETIYDAPTCDGQGD